MKKIITDTYEHYNNDAINQLADFAKQGRKFGLSVFSPPFSSLYSYSNSKQDMGNSKSNNLFYLHTRFFLAQLEKVIEDGRMVCVHLTNGTKTITSDGEQGLVNITGAYTALFEEFDFVWWSEININKSAAKAASKKPIPPLMFGTLQKDSTKCRQALTDKILIFKKRGDNKTPVTPVQNGDIDFDTWCKWADGVWMDIQETDVFRLNGVQAFRLAKDGKDERHLTPTQVEVYRRLIVMYSNPNEEVLDPFVGSGTAYHIGERLGRKVRGIELKESYSDLSERVAKVTKEEVEFLSRQPNLFA